MYFKLSIFLHIKLLNFYAMIYFYANYTSILIKKKLKTPLHY